MSHKQGAEGKRGGPENGTAQRQPGGPESQGEQAEAEAGAPDRETGYRPSVNQMRDEPVPASHHAPRGQEGEERNEQHAAGKLAARPSGRARRRGER